MSRSKKIRSGLVLTLAALILGAFLRIAVAEDVAAVVQAITEDRSTLAQTEGPAQVGSYDLSWWSADGGGTTSAAANGYSLGSTAGQPDAAVWSGGDYTLVGGFWGGALVEVHVYLPLVMRGS